MINIGKRRFWMRLGVVLVLSALAASCVDAAFFGLFKGNKKKTAAVIRQSLIVFPFDVSEGVKVPDGFGDDMAIALKSMLGPGSPYSVYIYRTSLPPIQRAKDDTLKAKADSEPPFAEDTAKSKKLAEILAADCFLVGGIDDYRVDAAKNVAMMTIHADLYLVASKGDKPLKTLVITGQSPSSSKATSDDELCALAAGDAVTKLKAELLEEPKTEVKPAAITAPANTPAAPAAKPEEKPVESAPIPADPAETPVPAPN